jgi:hypothetical protein
MGFERKVDCVCCDELVRSFDPPKPLEFTVELVSVLTLAIDDMVDMDADMYEPEVSDEFEFSSLEDG